MRFFQKSGKIHLIQGGPARTRLPERENEMLKYLSAALLISVILTIAAGCSTLNSGQTLPTPDDGQAASNTPADSTLEMYHWSDEAEPSE
ncbi:MAG TPA: hypothetical protein ENO21_03685 [Firmicutes bacterium]|nr:hypothetical protein [Bacillota bacterium]